MLKRTFQAHRGDEGFSASVVRRRISLRQEKNPKM
jgi:hypothetical protein